MSLDCLRSVTGGPVPARCRSLDHEAMSRSWTIGEHVALQSRPAAPKQVIGLHLRIVAHRGLFQHPRISTIASVPLRDDRTCRGFFALSMAARRLRGDTAMKAPSPNRRDRLQAMLPDLKIPARWRPSTASSRRPTAARSWRPKPGGSCNPRRRRLVAVHANGPGADCYKSRWPDPDRVNPTAAPLLETTFSILAVTLFRILEFRRWSGAHEITALRCQITQTITAFFSKRSLRYSVSARRIKISPITTRTKADGSCALRAAYSPPIE